MPLTCSGRDVANRKHSRDQPRVHLESRCNKPALVSVRPTKLGLDGHGVKHGLEVFDCLDEILFRWKRPVETIRLLLENPHSSLDENNDIFEITARRKDKEVL